MVSKATSFVLAALLLCQCAAFRHTLEPDEVAELTQEDEAHKVEVEEARATDGSAVNYYSSSSSDSENTSNSNSGGSGVQEAKEANDELNEIEERRKVDEEIRRILENDARLHQRAENKSAIHDSSSGWDVRAQASPATSMLQSLLTAANVESNTHDVSDEDPQQDNEVDLQDDPRAQANGAHITILCIFGGFSIFLYCIYFGALKKSHYEDMVSEVLEPMEWLCSDSNSASDTSTAKKIARAANIKKFSEGVNPIEIQSVKGPDTDLMQAPDWTRESMRNVLKEHNLSDAKWDDRAIDTLVNGLSTGGQLVVKDSKLMYEENLCLLFVEDRCSGQQKLLQESSPSDEGQPVKENGNGNERVPLCRFLPDESLYAAARRCIKDELEVAGNFVHMSRDCLFRVVEDEVSHPKLPGLACVERKYYVSATVETMNASDLDQIGLQVGFIDTKERRYVWRKTEDCRNLDKQTRDWLLHKQAAAEMKIDGKRSATERMVLPWSQLEAEKVLKKHNVESSKAKELFGKELPELVKMLKDGRIAFAIERTSNELVCLEDYIVCVVKTPAGLTLFKDDYDSWTVSDDHIDCSRLTADLPTMKKFSGESAWQAALRFLEVKMQLTQPALQLAPKVYTKSHSGLVQIGDLQANALEWKPDERTPKCQLRMFLVEGEINKTTNSMDLAG